MVDRIGLSMRQRWIAAWVTALVLLTGLRLYTIAQVPLTGDEAYHWRWSRHLAFGYYDHPPLIAWSVAFFNALFGVSLFSARLAGPLFAALTTVFVYLLGRDVSGSPRVGALAAVLFVLAPLPAIGMMAIIPDVPMVAGWAGTVYFLHRALFRDIARPEQPASPISLSNNFWLAGIFLGIAILGKLIAFFLIPSLFLYLLVSPAHRAWLRRPHPYLFVLTGLLVASPFLLWNAAHDWETFAYQLRLRLIVREPQQALFNPRTFLDFVVYQAVALSPIVFVLGMGVLAFLIRNGIRQEPRDLFLATFCVPVLLFFAAVSFRTRGGEHWPFAGYLSLLVGMAWMWERLGRAYRVALASAMTLAAAMTAALFVVLLKPGLLFALVGGNGINYHGINKGQQVQASELAEIYGYEALGRKVADTVRGMNARHSTFVITDSYALSSVLAFYSGLETHVARGSILGREYRRWDRFGEKLGEDALYIDLAPLGRRPDITAMLEAAFDRVEADAPFVTDWEGQPVRPFYLVRCYGFRRNLFQRD